MIDTHVHLDLIDDARPALEAAVNAGVTDVIGIGVDPRVPSTPKVTLPAGLRVHHALGLHPQALGDLTSPDALRDALTLLDARLTRERAAVPDALGHTHIVALGETGLDARPNMPDEELQQRAFTAQLALARTHDLPVVLHGVRRDAAMLAALDRELARPATEVSAPLRAVWHGFSASKETMREAVARGAYISIGFMVLNDKARRVLEAVPHIPEDRLLVETDAPPLAPAKLAEVVARVAALRGTTVDEIVRVTRANAARVFGLI